MAFIFLDILANLRDRYKVALLFLKSLVIATRNLSLPYCLLSY